MLHTPSVVSSLTAAKLRFILTTIRRDGLWCLISLWLVTAVDSLSVAEGKHDDKEDVILDCIDDAVVAHPHAVGVAGSQFLRAWGSGVGSKKGDGAPDAVRVRLWNRTQGFDCSGPKLNAIGHCQPRSALTCSQGILPPSSASASSKARSSSRSSSASNSCS